jgi:hypothetical protein
MVSKPADISARSGWKSRGGDQQALKCAQNFGAPGARWKRAIERGSRSHTVTGFIGPAGAWILRVLVRA